MGTVLGVIVIALYLIFIPIIIYYRLIYFIKYKTELNLAYFMAVDFCTAFFLIWAFFDFEAPYSLEQHSFNKSSSVFILVIGYVAYYINNLLSQCSPHKIEQILLVVMTLSLLYSIYFIGEIIFSSNGYKLIKLRIVKITQLV